MGEAALNANMMGHNGVNWSYNVRASLMLQHWNVNWRQQQPIPKPIASMWMWSGFSGVLPSTGICVFLSLNTETKHIKSHSNTSSNQISPGISIDTFEPRRILMLRDNVLKRGCPGKMASSTKYNDFATPSSASGLGAYEGNVKLGLFQFKTWIQAVSSWIKRSYMPSIGKLVIHMATSFSFSSFATSSLRLDMFASTTLKWASSPPYGLPGVPSTFFEEEINEIRIYRLTRNSHHIRRIFRPP